MILHHCLSETAYSSGRLTAAKLILIPNTQSQLHVNNSKPFIQS